MKILVINAGSSSLKYQFIDMGGKKVLAKGICERIGIEASRIKHDPNGREQVVITREMKDHSDAIKLVISVLLDKNHGVISSMKEISAVGHRVVHGGENFSQSVLIDQKVKDTIRDCTELAPLHNGPNLIGIEACEAVMPGVPQVAVFDTAFHQTMPPEAFLYALPYEYYQKYKIRKYGFHGTSHKYVSARAAAMLGRPIEELKIITFHLGNGSSVAAVKNGKSIETSMGFTPLDGVIMGTRCGALDPAIVFYAMDKAHLDIPGINAVLNKKSGVLGISGVSSDFRDLDRAAEAGNERAKLALLMFDYSVKQYIGRYASVMGGLDAIVFTAGVGENNCALRASVTREMGFMGIKVDPEKNAVRGEEMDVSAPDSKVRVLVVPTNEEMMIALDTQKIVETL